MLCVNHNHSKTSTKKNQVAAVRDRPLVRLYSLIPCFYVYICIATHTHTKTARKCAADSSAAHVFFVCRFPPLLVHSYLFLESKKKKMLPTVIGLSSIPFIIHPIDEVFFYVFE
jgi:hypothetical protein